MFLHIPGKQKYFVNAASHPFSIDWASKLAVGLPLPFGMRIRKRGLQLATAGVERFRAY